VCLLRKTSVRILHKGPIFSCAVSLVPVSFALLSLAWRVFLSNLWLKSSVPYSPASAMFVAVAAGSFCGDALSGILRRTSSFPFFLFPQSLLRS